MVSRRPCNPCQPARCHCNAGKRTELHRNDRDDPPRGGTGTRDRNHKQLRFSPQTSTKPARDALATTEPNMIAAAAP